MRSHSSINRIDVDRWGVWLVGIVLAVGLLALYAYTSAPGVLAGDSAEFQFAAPLLGVPHPTTYPLYTLLGWFSAVLVPLRTPAWRVTFVSAVCAALAVLLLLVLARRIGMRLGAALIGALMLGLSPGVWNAATQAEVYTLLLLLLCATALALLAAHERPALLGVAAFLTGMGFSHHGLFVFAGLPLLLLQVLRTSCAADQAAQPRRARFWLVARVGGAFVLGLWPWLYTLVQYARYGPFDGQDFGLPRHYFWGAPQSWAEAAQLLIGGPISGSLFRLPDAADTAATLRLVTERGWFELGPFGLALALVGLITLTRRNRAVAAGAMLVFGGTGAYLLLIGPAAQDAPIFTLPMLLPGALWVACGADAIIAWVQRRRWQHASPLAQAVLGVLLVGALVWGITRMPYANKRHLHLFREFGTATLTALPPGAVVVTHWEHGTTLQYLRLVEGLRPDVWVDIVEPGDEAWGARAARRYTGRTVYFVGPRSSLGDTPVVTVRETTYTNVYRWVAR